MMDNANISLKVDIPYEYAITVTFKNVRATRPLNQFKETAPYLTKLLSKSTQYELFPEWRDTTGAIHYHGMLLIKDKVKWFKQTLPSLRLCGFILIKKIDNRIKWSEYIRKDLSTASAILPLSLPLPLSSEVILKEITYQKENNINDLLNNLCEVKKNGGDIINIKTPDETSRV